jgi:IS4 transposase
MVYAFNATTINLCLSIYPWAPFRSTQAAIKLHTLLDLRGSIPSFIHISEGKTHEVNVLDKLTVEPGAFYLMDRGYLDFGKLYAIHEAGAFFVTRTKSNTQFRRRYPHPVDRATINIVCDQTGVLTVFYSRKDYPAPLRRVLAKNDIGKRITFLTNNFALKPELIARLYKQRWQVELFFKWIKQHLRIKTFFGTSENAVKHKSGWPSPLTC